MNDEQIDRLAKIAVKTYILLVALVVVGVFVPGLIILSRIMWAMLGEM